MKHESNVKGVQDESYQECRSRCGEVKPELEAVLSSIEMFWCEIFR